VPYRIAYAGQADAARRHLPERRRHELDDAMRRTLAQDPYSHGSTEAKPGEKDYREATVAGMIVVYYVSASVLTVTAVQLINI
jgi:hypothetical protein